MKCGRFFFVKIENVVHRKKILCAGVLHEQRKSFLFAERKYLFMEEMLFIGKKCFVHIGICASRKEVVCSKLFVFKKEVLCA